MPLGPLEEVISQLSLFLINRSYFENKASFERNFLKTTMASCCFHVRNFRTSFTTTISRRNFKMQQLSVILCSRKTWSWKSRDHHDVIVFESSKCSPSTRKRKAGVFKFFRFQSMSKKLRFRHGLVWTVGLTVGKKKQQTNKFLRVEV